MVMQETICWPNLGCALLRAVCRCRSRIHSEAGNGSSCSAMTQHYPTTSAAAAVWASGSSFPVSAMLLIYTYSLLPARALSSSSSAVAEKPRCMVGPFWVGGG